MKIPVYDVTGKKVDELTLNIADVDVSGFEFSRAIRVYEFALHQGTKKTKSRGEVSYSKRKPWPQKGTGRARAGTRGSPIWVGGGVAHGPKPYTRRLHLNKKEKKRVFTWLFRKHLEQGDIMLLRITYKDKPLTTKEAVEILKALQVLPFKVYYVTGIKDEITPLGFRNLPRVQVRRTQLLSVFDLYHKGFFVINEKYFDDIKSRLLLEDETS